MISFKFAHYMFKFALIADVSLMKSRAPPSLRIFAVEELKCFTLEQNRSKLEGTGLLTSCCVIVKHLITKKFKNKPLCRLCKEYDKSMKHCYIGTQNVKNCRNCESNTSVQFTVYPNAKLGHLIYLDLWAFLYIRAIPMVEIC